MKSRFEMSSARLDGRATEARGVCRLGSIGLSMRVALVSCVKSKLDRTAPAKDLYTSPLFRALRNYAERHSDRWYILSAEHGLLDPERVIEPYERTVNSMSMLARQEWAHRVQADLRRLLPEG